MSIIVKLLVLALTTFLSQGDTNQTDNFKKLEQEFYQQLRNSNLKDLNTTLQNGDLSGGAQLPQLQDFKFDQDHYYNVGETVVGQAKKIDQFISRKKIHINEIEKPYLFFKAEGSQTLFFMDIKLPSQENNYSFPCIVEQIDSCFIPKQMLQNNSTLTVQITCKEECQYLLKTYWSSVEHLIPNNSVKYYFGTNASQLFHAELQQKKEYEQIRFTMIPQVSRLSFSEVTIYLSFGSDSEPTPKKYDYKSFNLMGDGVGIFLKKEQVRENKMRLLVSGKSQSIYVLQFEVLQKSHHDLKAGQEILEYMLANKTNIYHINVTEVKGAQKILKLSKHSGKLNVTYYTDKALTKKYASQPFTYMQDTQLVINQQISSQLKTNGIYVKAESKESDTVFGMKFEVRNQSSMIELRQNVFEYLVVEQDKNRVAYIEFFKLQDPNWYEIDQTINFTIHLSNVYGKANIKFRLCNKYVVLCKQQTTYQQSSEEITKDYVDSVENEEKITYKLKVNTTKQYANLKGELSGVVILEIKALRQQATVSQGAVIVLEYINTNKIQYLRAGRSLEEHLAGGQVRIYKYVNSDPNVNKIRVILNEISGKIMAYGTRKITQTDVNKTENYQQLIGTNNLFQFTERITDPIFITAYAVYSSIISLSLNVIYKHNDFAQTTLTMAQNIQYKLSISPDAYQVLEIMGMNQNLTFSFVSTGTVSLCLLNKDDVCHNANQTYGSEGDILIRQGFMNSLKMKVYNPSRSKIIIFKAIYHLIDNQHCELKKMSHVYDEELAVNQCIKYLIHEKQDFQISLIRKSYSTLNFIYMLCLKQIKLESKDKENFVFPAQSLKKYCQDKQPQLLIGIVANQDNSEFPNLAKSVKLQYIVQYITQVSIVGEGVPVFIRDYIAYEGKRLKQIAYQPLMNHDITIQLSQFKGEVNFMAAIRREQIYRIQKREISDYIFKTSSNRKKLVISKQNLNKDTCQFGCAVIVAVYATKTINQQVQCALQIFQDMLTLQIGIPYVNYVSKDTINNYKVHINVGNHILEISDNNQQCAEIYFSEKEYPNKYYNKNQMLNKVINNYNFNCKIENYYYVSVALRQEQSQCYYTITIKQSEKSIEPLFPTTNYNLVMQQGQVKMYLLPRADSKPFKLVALHKYGEIRIYMNPVRQQDYSKDFDYTEFNIVGEQNSALKLKQDNPNFCKICTYIVAIKAIKATMSTLRVMELNEPIVLYPNKVFQDYLQKKDDQTLIKYNKYGKIEFLITIRKGSVQLSQSQGPESTSKILKTSLQTYIQQYQNIKSNQLLLKLKALQDNVQYSVQVRNEFSEMDNQLAKYMNIQTGRNNYLVLNIGDIICLSGFLRSDDQNIYIGSAKDQNVLESLKIEMKVKGEIVKVEEKSYYQVKALILPRGNYKRNHFELCLKINDDEDSPPQIAHLTVLQMNNVNALQMEKESLSEGQTTYVLHPNGQFFVDIMQCSGTEPSKIYYANSLKNLNEQEKMKDTVLNIAKLQQQSHAIKIEAHETTFLSVKGQRQKIRWQLINSEREIGIGYTKYAIGNLKYQTEFNELKIIFQSLYKAQATQTKLLKAVYQFYFSSSEQDLMAAVNCGDFDSKKVFSYIIHEQTSVDDKSTSLSSTISKQKLSSIFSNESNFYFNIAILLQIQPPTFNNKDEHYRFVYQRQIVPAVAFNQSVIQKISLPILVLIILAAFTVLFFLFYLIVKKFVPLISRLRNRGKLSQEQGEDHGQQLPQTSQRKRAENLPETENKMYQ